MSLPRNSARDKDFPATSVSFRPQGDALFFPPTCLGKKAVLQGDIILAISSRKLYVTLTYPDMFLWRRLSGSTSTPASDSAVKCSSCTQGVLCSLEGRQALYWREAVSSLTVTMSAGRDAFNWANLLCVHVCICVWLVRYHHSSLLILALDLKHLYLVHRLMCSNWHLVCFLRFCSQG